MYIIAWPRTGVSCGTRDVFPYLMIYHPKYLGVNIGDTCTRTGDFDKFKWFLQRLSIPVAGTPYKQDGNGNYKKKVVVFGNYPKPPLGKKYYNTIPGLRSMTERDPKKGQRYSNQSINTMLEMLPCMSVDPTNPEDMTCDKFDDQFIMCDLMPFQLFYAANTKGILRVMKNEFPIVYQLFVEYHRIVFSSIEQVMQEANQDPSVNPIFALGADPYGTLHRDSKVITNGLPTTLKCIGRTIHPCVFTHKTCMSTRTVVYTDGDVVMSEVATFLCGRKLKNTYHTDFMNANKHTMGSIAKKLSERHRHMQANPSEAQLNHQQNLGNISREFWKNPIRSQALRDRRKIRTPAQKKHALSLKGKGANSPKRKANYAARWNGMLLEAIEYKYKHGTFNILTNDTENTKLRCWIEIQRRKYINKELYDERIKSLNEIKFDWGFRWINKLKVKVV